MKELCVQVLCNGDSLDIVKDLLELANQQCVQGFKTRDIVKESLRTVLLTYRYVVYNAHVLVLRCWCLNNNCLFSKVYNICLFYSHPDDKPEYVPEETTSSDLLTKLLTTLHEHINSATVTKKYVKEEDILQEIRTFCADETVLPEVKHEVLQLIEKIIKLTGEDKTLLLYHQTQAIVHKHWEIEVGVISVAIGSNEVLLLPHRYILDSSIFIEMDHLLLIQCYYRGNLN